MNLYLRILFLAITLVFCSQCNQDNKTKNHLSVLVITGGHHYDTAEFELMFREMPGISVSFAEKPAAWNLLDKEATYKTLVFYDMYQEITEEEKKRFLAEFDKGTGMVFIHHSLGSHQEWPEYAELVGGKFYMEGYTEDTSLVLGYEHDIKIHVNVIDPIHPVTEGIEDFEVIDEGYTKTELVGGLNYILETEHPGCDRYTGWTHTVRNSRVVYLMGGHDKQAYENVNFSRIVENAIRWTSERKQ